MRATPVFVVLVSGILATSAAAQGSVGWTYAMRITTDSGQGTTPSVMGMRQLVRGNKLRMESSLAGAPAMLEDAYSIFNGADSTMTMVMPSEHSAMITPLGLAGAMRMQSMAVRSTNSDVVDLGAGESILGHPTHRYRVASSGAVDITIGGHTCTKKMETVSEVWIAGDVDLEQATRAASQTMKSFAPTVMIDQWYGTARSHLPPGTALRNVMTMQSYDASGTAHPVKMTVEITELSHGEIADSVFAIPADYQSTDMREMLKMVPAGMMDSITKAQSSKMSSAMCDDVTKQ